MASLRLGQLRAWVADRLMPWVSANAHVWPSQHSVHKGLVAELKETHLENETMRRMLLDRGMTAKHIEQEIAMRKNDTFRGWIRPT